MGNAIDVDAAGRDIGRHQDAQLTGTKPLQGALAGALGFVAVDRLGVDAGLAELFGDPVGTVLGARKHQHPRHRRILQNVGQQGLLLPRADVIDALFDTLDRRRPRCHLDMDRIGQNIGRQTDDLGRHGG